MALDNVTIKGVETGVAMMGVRVWRLGRTRRLILRGIMGWL
ncbi:hypothetical protein [Bartonella schoenbuchensis]|nr:hypothetical protein [Bartonella schoenbuchensis]